jgi:hypothetical protein
MPRAADGVPTPDEQNAEYSREYRCTSDAVGTIITDRPPRRSVRALLRIRLPPGMSGEEASYRIGMQNAGSWNPPRGQRNGRGVGG